jgi:hypothetical protein
MSLPLLCIRFMRYVPPDTYIMTRSEHELMVQVITIVVATHDTDMAAVVCWWVCEI